MKSVLVAIGFGAVALTVLLRVWPMLLEKLISILTASPF